jgi:hypothetical protein
MIRITSSNKTDEYVPSSSADLPVVIENWHQAVIDLHTWYETLSQTIAAHKQVACKLMHPGANFYGQHPLCDLEQVHCAMIQEISQLISVMDKSWAQNQLSEQATIECLHAHTIRLQEQARRIQQVLCQSTLNAS